MSEPYNEGPVRAELIRRLADAVAREHERQVRERVPTALESPALRILQVDCESHKHKVPPKSEHHFKVVIVSNIFADKTAFKSLVARHRFVNHAVGEELFNGQGGRLVHALAMTVKSEEEWLECGGVVGSTPACLGFGGAEVMARVAQMNAVSDASSLLPAA